MENVFNADQMKDVAFNACCRTLGFNAEDVVRIAGGELVLNCVKVSWYVSD